MSDGIIVELPITQTNHGKVIPIGFRYYNAETLQPMSPHFWGTVTASGSCGTAKFLLTRIEQPKE